MCRKELIHIVLILLLSVPYAVSDNCVRYTFEQNYEEWLTHEWRNITCHSTWPFWIEDKYSNIDLSAENDQSTTFIRPTPSNYSCVTSFIFTMQYNGKIEVNIYMDDEERRSKYIDIFARTVEGDYLGSSNDFYWSNFESGWHTLKIILKREGSYEGYLTFEGWVVQSSTVLVDSFRYIPPNMDESDCRLYEDETTTPEPNTPEPSTPEPSTQETSTSEPTTLKPTTLAPADKDDNKGFRAPFSFNFSFNFTTFLRT